MKQIAIYLRVSGQDKTGGLQSHSIRNQKALLLNHLQLPHDAPIVLIDDGYSGSHTRRPAFQQLCALIEDSAISTLLVKDFSRFSRDHILLLDYVTHILPQKGIRFIAVTEGYDSISQEQFLLPLGFRSILHSYYCYDLSMKTKTAIHAKQKEGHYFSGASPFGYERGNEGNYILVPSDAALVQSIFQQAEKGASTHQIACRLNREGIPTKEERRGRSSGEKRLWRGNEVSRILRNEAYLGRYISSKWDKVSPRFSLQRQKNREDWCIHEGGLPPLVTPECFQRVNPSSTTNHSTKEQIPSPWKGLLHCGYCGFLLRRYRGNSYGCITPKWKEDALCFRDKISLEHLSHLGQVVLTFLAHLLLESHVLEKGQCRHKEKMAREKRIWHRKRVAYIESILQGEQGDNAPPSPLEKEEWLSLHIPQLLDAIHVTSNTEITLSWGFAPPPKGNL